MNSKLSKSLQKVAQILKQAEQFDVLVLVQATRNGKNWERIRMTKNSDLLELKKKIDQGIIKGLIARFYIKQVAADTPIFEIGNLGSGALNTTAEDVLGNIKSFLEAVGSEKFNKAAEFAISFNGLDLRARKFRQAFGIDR